MKKLQISDPLFTLISVSLYSQEPAADPEVDDPEVKQTAVNVEEEPSASTDATPAEEEEVRSSSF